MFAREDRAVSRSSSCSPTPRTARAGFHEKIALRRGAGDAENFLDGAVIAFTRRSRGVAEQKTFANRPYAIGQLSREDRTASRSRYPALHFGQVSLRSFHEKIALRRGAVPASKFAPERRLTGDAASAARAQQTTGNPKRVISWPTV